MKQVHNVRVRVIDKDKVTVKQILDTVLTQAGIERKDVELLITSDQDEEEPIFVGELWIDHQQPVRKMLALLGEKLAPRDRAAISSNPHHHLDTGTHCFLRFAKGKFIAGEYELVQSGSVVHVRLNIAAFPATKENAAKILSELFSD